MNLWSRWRSRWKLPILLALVLCMMTGALLYIKNIRPIYINVSNAPIVKIEQYGQEIYCMDKGGSVFRVFPHSSTYRLVQAHQIPGGNSLEFDSKRGRFFYSSAELITAEDLTKKKNATIWAKSVSDYAYFTCMELLGDGRLFVGVAEAGVGEGRRILDVHGNFQEVHQLSPPKVSTFFEEMLCSASPKGRYLSIWDEENGLWCYDTIKKSYGWVLSRQQVQFEFKGASNFSLSHLSAGDNFVAVSEDASGKVALLSLQDGKSVHVFNSGHAHASLSCLSKDSSMLAIAGDSGFISIWNTKTFGEIKRIKFTQPVTALAFSENKEHLIIGDKSGGVTLWPLG